jgi:flagellar hook-associated protein 3 FlgL
MSFRISTFMIYERGVNAMLKQQSELSQTQLQISTGRRILSPSDDPAGATRELDYNRKIDTLGQYLNNADRARTRLEMEEAAIASVENILLRVKELTVQGSNDTLSATDRQAIASEIRQLRDEMKGLANTRDAQGEYIFAGYQTSTRPFEEAANGAITYNGDLGSRQLQISEDRKVADGDNGYTVFVDVNTETGKRDMFETLHQIALDLESDQNPNSYLNDIDLALADTTEIRTTIGARMNTIDDQVAVNQEVKLVLETHRAEEGDLDYAEAISRFDRQLVALQAAQQAFIKVSELSLFNYLR